MSEPLVVVDLFCGAGGFSTGAGQACEDLDRETILYAINHWERAIETHERNHPWAKQFHSKVEELHPPNVVEEDHVDLLVGGPECTHFSNARGGKPVSEQQRASPWHVVDWLEKLDVQAFLIENVPELESWGPVDDGRATRNGEIFEAWINALQALGYSVDWRVLNAADYGDPTSRERLFIAGRRDYRATFPEPTHSEGGGEDTDPWRSAAEIIDWTEPGGSIWTRDLHDARKRPLKNSTMQRIAEGIRRHCADRFAPLADALGDLGREDVVRLREQVVPAEYAQGAAEVLDEPFLVEVDAQPALTAPYLLRQQSGGVPPSVDEPLPTISSAGAVAKVESRPLIMPRNGPRGGLHSNSLYRPEDRPLHVVTAKNTDGYLVMPSLIRYSHGGATLDIGDPMPTIATEKGGVFALSSPVVRPFLDDYEGAPETLAKPLKTQTSRDRFALCVPECYPWGLDVRYRMLQPRELKQAQGFPADYDIAGNKTETTKQIGNAVPVNLAKALVLEQLTGEQPSLRTYLPDEQVAADGGESA